MLRLLGQAYEGEGNNEAALAAYTKALTLKDDSRSRTSRGKLFMSMKRVDEAQEDAIRALVLDPENGGAAAMLSSLGATISP